MSSNPINSNHHYSVKPLAVSLRPSRLLALLLGGACLGAVALLLLLPLPGWGKALATAAMLGGGWHALRRHAWLRAAQSIRGIEVNVRGELRCRTPAQDWQPAQVLGSSTVTPWLVVLNLRFEGRRLARHAVLLPDSADAATLRRLRVWLRWGALHE